MSITVPVVLTLVSAIASFQLFAKLRHFKVREKPPASRAHLSVEERQRRLTIGDGFGLLAAA
jgi:hypothetical protein